MIVGRIPRPYDLMWPVARRIESGGSMLQDVNGRVVDETGRKARVTIPRA